MTIWCGTDFSPSAAEAAHAAAALARRMGGPMRLLHIVDELGAEQAFGSSDDAVFNPRRARIEAQVRELMAHNPGVEMSGAVLPGFVEETLTGWANGPGDLLIVAALGRRPASARRLLGGTADRVAQLAQTPVLVIRRAEPFLSWSESRPLRIVVGVDLSVQSRSAVRFVESLRAVGPCDVTLLHVLQPGELAPRLRITPAEREARRPELAVVVEQDLRRALGELTGAGQQTLRIEPEIEHIEEALAEHAAAADLLVLGTHQRRGLARFWYGSVSRGALTLAGTNVALIPNLPLPEEAAPEVRFQSALVPIDLEAAPATVHLPYAVGLLERGGTLHLLYVVRTQPLSAESKASYLDELRAAAEPLMHARSLKLEVHVVEEADLSAAILQAAARLGVDALCIGPQRPRSALSELVMGSTTREVLARCRCPVLLVPPKDT